MNPVNTKWNTNKYRDPNKYLTVDKILPESYLIKRKKEEERREKERREKEMRKKQQYIAFNSSSDEDGNYTDPGEIDPAAEM